MNCNLLLKTISLSLLFLNSCANTNWKLKTETETSNQPNSPSSSQTPAAAVAKEWTCSHEAFGKTFMGKGSSEVEAKSKSLSSCSAKYSSMHCDLIECGSN